MAIDGDPCLKSIPDLPCINTENSIRFIGDVIASVTVAASQTFHRIGTAEQRAIIPTYVCSPCQFHRYRPLDGSSFVVATEIRGHRSMRPIFMIQRRKREGNCHRVERQAFLRAKVATATRFDARYRVVNHRFPNFERLFYRNMV